VSEHRVVIVGAGGAGIATALALSDRGIRPLIIDHATQVGSSWRARYDRLRLNSCRQLSHLPGRRLPKGTPLFPTRDDMIAHLERHSDVIALALLRAPTRFADAMARFGRRMDIGNLDAYRLPIPEEGVMSRLKRLGVAPAIVDKEVIDAIKARHFEITRGVETLDATGVTLADGARLEPDVIICATGYRRGLEPLVGHLDVLDDRGVPRARGPQPAAPGLRFIGYVPRPAQLAYAVTQAKQAAKAIARDLHTSHRRLGRQNGAL
jgi:cation diffusion facilitator CzcD-associated flavoprotein CzcO